MEISYLLHLLGALVTVVLGAFGLLRPREAAQRAGVEPRGVAGLSEIRGTYGGLFAAMGAFALFAQDSVAFALLGAAWIGAALGRLSSVLLDGNREPRIFRTALFEGLLGILFLV